MLFLLQRAIAGGAAADPNPRGTASEIGAVPDEAITTLPLTLRGTNAPPGNVVLVLDGTAGQSAEVEVWAQSQTILTPGTYREPLTVAERQAREFHLAGTVTVPVGLAMSLATPWFGPGNVYFRVVTAPASDAVLRVGVAARTRPALAPTPIDIWGSDLEIWWQFTDPWLTYSGSDVTLVTNQANPGTYDLPAIVAPVFVAGGLDGQDCVEFDGSSERMEVTGLPWVANDTIDVYVVAEIQTVRTSDYICEWDAGSGIRLAINSDFSGTPQMGIQVATDPAGVSPPQWGAMDTDPHLYGASMYDAGVGNGNVHGWLDGSGINGASSQNGLLGAISRMGLGSFYGGAGPAHVRVAELVAIRNDSAGEAHRLAFQSYVASKYPTIGAAIP